jgi:hypothetical protein
MRIPDENFMKISAYGRMYHVVWAWLNLDFMNDHELRLFVEGLMKKIIPISYVALVRNE